MALDFRNSCLKNFNELLIYNLRQRNCNINMVKKLLAHKIDVNYKDCFLNTALHYVVQNCSDKLDLIREILNMEGNPNAVNAEGNSPLHLAVLKSNVHVILELMKFGGDVRLTNNRGNTPLHVAAMRGKPCIIETLLKADTSLINCGNIRKNTPLIMAAIHDRGDMIKILVESGAELQYRNKDGNSPLHMAVILNREDVVKTLFEFDEMFLDDLNIENNTPLHLAVINGNLNIIHSLLNIGADFYCTDAEGNTPLHLAVANNKIDIVEVFIKNKADVRCINKKHMTPMHIAAINGNSKLIQLLNDNDGPVDCIDEEGNTPLHLSVIHDQPSAIETLFMCHTEHICNKNGYAPLHLAAISNKSNLVEILLRLGAFIDCRDAELNTPMHLATIHNNPEIVVKLIKSGAKTDLLNQDSHTPIQVAALLGNVNIINVLFQNGVRIKLRNQGRRYISSFAQSLIQHSNVASQAATSGNSQSGTAGGISGATQSNSAATSGSTPSTTPSFPQFLSVSNPIHSVAPAGYPVTTYSISTNNAAPSVESPTIVANSLIQEMQQFLIVPSPGLPEIPMSASTTGASSVSTNVASTSHAGNTSFELADDVIPLDPETNQPIGFTGNVGMNPVQNNIHPVVAQTISEITNSLNSFEALIPSSPSQENFGGSGISSANSFSALIFDADHPNVVGPIIVPQPPSLATVQAWTLANANNHGAGGSSQSGTGNNIPQQAQNSYSAFLNELDSEGDPMSWSWSPFLRTSKVEETAIIDNLVKFYGINGRNRSKNELLQQALVSDDPVKIASFLKSSTGNISKSLRRENSPLHLAVVYGKPKLVKALIQSGVVVDFKNNELNTPLHFAAFCGESEIIDILVQSGANLDIMNRRGATPLKYSFSYCQEGIMKNLGKFGTCRFLLSAKTLIKYDVLKKGLYLTRHKILKANCVCELLSFVEDCCNEALYMKQKLLDKNYSFYQFVNQALNNSEPLSKSPYVEDAVEYLIGASSKDVYPIYNDTLISLMSAKLGKGFFRKKLLYVVEIAEEEGKICLNRKLFTMICKYLSNVDLLNVLVAFSNI